MQTRVWVRKPGGPPEIASLEPYETPCHHCHQQAHQSHGGFTAHKKSLILLRSLLIEQLYGRLRYMSILLDPSQK